MNRSLDRENGSKRTLKSPALVALLSVSLLGAAATAPRRIAIRAPSDFLAGPESQRLSGWSRRLGFEIQIATEDAAVPDGWESVRLSTLPCSIDIRRRLARFPLRLEGNGFVFDGHAYTKPEDAIALAEPAGAPETIVVGNSRRAVLRLAATRLFWGEDRPPDYDVLSGDLSKRGRFRQGPAPLAIDRASDKDEIAAQADFLRTQKTEERGGVVWRLRESERGGLEKWEPVLRRFRRPGVSAPLTVRLFPDAVTKARATGSSRPADLSSSGGDIIVDLDVSAPAGPDCISPTLASAALGADQKRLLARPTLLAAAGARACGRWWGRDVAGFAAWLHRARVEPTPREVIKGDETVSPILAVGAAAAWLDAGARAQGEGAVQAALLASDAECERTMSAWSALAARGASPAPASRPLPSGFLRGVSYAMTNTVGSSYASPRSRETLASLAKMSVNSISVMPFAFSSDTHSPEILFVHRHPAGETDEGTVRAVSDAHALGMSALVKPQIWLGGGQFVGEIAMRGDADWTRWFDAYRRFIVHEAVVAEAAGADAFCVGTELLGTEQRPQWADVIAAVRLATGAPLIYAANWAAGAPKVPFWPALDAIGVDYYDPLSKDAAASDEALTQGVRQAAATLGGLSRRTGKPVIFAEAGYPPVAAAWTAPHDEDTRRPSAPADAARAVAAVFRGLEKEPWWRGVYWWKVFSDGRAARDGERGYNLLGTPAQRTITEAFARLAREAPGR